ncbi:MAG TPA: hypothetical protein VFZ91_16405 [Allosphingosinicella sp.]
MKPILFLLAGSLSLVGATASAAPVRQSRPPAAAAAPAIAPLLTPEGYRDLIVSDSDEVYLLESSVITAMRALQRDKVCVLDIDTSKAKLAAEDAANHGQVWRRQRVPQTLAASHAEIASWIDSAGSILKVSPACIYGGSMELLSLLATFGAYDGLRKKADAELTALGVTLPPMRTPPRPAR